jgi:hypothetical protein
VQADHIRGRHQFVDIAPTEAWPVGRIFSAFVRGDDGHSRGCRNLADVAADSPESHDAHGLALEFNQGRFPEAKVRGFWPLARMSGRTVKRNLMAKLQQ